MGCGASTPASVHATPGVATPTLKRPASSPVIVISANTAVDAQSSSLAADDSSADLTIDKAMMVASRQIPVGDQVSKIAASGGVTAIIALMKAHPADAEFQWWCCDALASLSAGNEDNRAQIFVHGGVVQVLTAMRFFMWDENVQTKSNWALANLAASYAEHCGKQGSVEAVVHGMKSNPESYQVQASGVRALQNLVAASDTNRARAIEAGSLALLIETLERNPEDGQLQWRSQELQAKLAAMSEETVKSIMASGAAQVARTSPWSPQRQAAISGQAKGIAGGNVPGLHGISAEVAEVAALGPKAVVTFMDLHKGDNEAQVWCCDALATLMTGNEPARMEVFTSGGLSLILSAMRNAVWEEELQLKGIWALLGMASSFQSEIGDADAIRTVVVAMYANKNAHQVQVAGVKLISLLTIEPHNKNVERAVDANAVRIIKSCIAAYADDGTLQYRGVNLLERLQPGCTVEMPKQAMIRSYSMRAEEMVSQYRMSARTFAKEDSQLSMGGSVGASHSVHLNLDAIRPGDVSGDVAHTGRSSLLSDTTRMLRSAEAIAEVDELAEAVEEQDFPTARPAEQDHGEESGREGVGKQIELVSPGTVIAEGESNE